jgi:hypothetical protein
MQWYVNGKEWNAMAYPWAQSHFWYRSLFPVWKDWDIKVSFLPFFDFTRPFNRGAVANTQLQPQWVKKPATRSWKKFILALILFVGAGSASLNAAWLRGVAILLRQRVGL